MRHIFKNISLFVFIGVLEKHLINDWIEKDAPNSNIRFAVSRLTEEQINTIKDKELRDRALNIKKELECKGNFKK